MSKLITRLLTCAAMLPLALFTACESNAPRREDPELLRPSMGIDIIDFNNAAKLMAEEMLQSPRLRQSLEQASRRQGGRNPLVVCTRIRNDSGLKINMYDYLVGPIREVFINNGKLDFYAEDQGTRDIAQARDMLEGGQPRPADLTIYGVVSVLHTPVGDTDQRTYLFEVTVSDAKESVDVFTKRKQIGKTTGRPGVAL
jgi:hypothetical protein